MKTDIKLIIAITLLRWAFSIMPNSKFKLKLAILFQELKDPNIFNQ